jgi:hypothetical protein
MHVQGNGGHLKGGVLRLPGPDELGIEVRIVGVAIDVRYLTIMLFSSSSIAPLICAQ